MKSIQEQKLDQAFMKALEPPLQVDIISHSEQSIWLSPMFTSQKNVGYLNLDKTPYLKYILKTVFDEDMDLTKISFCAGTQCGKTTAIMAILSYIICHRPGPTMMLMPTASTAKALSKDRLQVIFKDSPAIREELTGSDDDFQLLNYLFKNMSLSLVHSETQVRSRPVKYLLQDEIAVIDPFIVKSSLDRTKSFSGRKIISVSSPEFPTDPIWKSLGIIRDYEEEKIVTQEGGTLGGIPIRRYKQNPKSSTVCHWYHVKCPHCNQSQQLFPDLLRWKRFDKKTKKTIPIWQLGSDDNTWYECSNCHGRIYDRHKKTMVVNGEWKNETGVVGKSISFQINSLYTLLGDACQWSEIVAIWLNAKGDPDAERSVVNSFFAFPYVAEEFGENVISMEKIKKLSESAGYRRNTTPDEVLILTSGIDVQKDQMYWSTYGHSEDGTR